MRIKVEVEEAPGQTGTGVIVKLHERVLGMWKESERRFAPIGSVTEIEFPSFGYVILQGPDQEMEQVVEYDPVQKAAKIKQPPHAITKSRFIGPTS